MTKRRIIIIAALAALAALLAVPALALGGNTTTVSGTLNATISVTAPDNINFSTFAVGTNTASSLDGDVSVTGATQWQVTAKDEKTTDAGFMTKTGGKLTNKLQISKDNSNYYTADTGITYNNPGENDLDLYVNQVVTSQDPAGTYSITITFTGTVTQ